MLQNGPKIVGDHARKCSAVIGVVVNADSTYYCKHM